MQKSILFHTCRIYDSKIFLIGTITFDWPLENFYATLESSSTLLYNLKEQYAILNDGWSLNKWDAIVK